MYLPLEYDTPPGHYSEKQMAQTQGIFTNIKAISWKFQDCFTIF
jgi:hypothetical protein